MSNSNDKAKLEQSSENSSKGGMQGTIGTGNLQSQGDFNTFVTTVSKIKGQTSFVNLYRIIGKLELSYGLSYEEIYPSVGELYERDSKFRSLIDAIDAYQKWENIRCNRAAATELSTPPDSPTTIFLAVFAVICAGVFSVFSNISGNVLVGIFGDRTTQSKL